MKSNESLQMDVKNVIKWRPLLHAFQNGISAKDGVVALTGDVNSYAKKPEVELHAKKVIGVNALVEEIEVQSPVRWARTDEKIAAYVLAGLNSCRDVPKDKVTIKVEDTWITHGIFHVNNELEVDYYVLID